jgi:hypothetical protein
MRGGAHGQLPFVVSFIEAKDVHTAVIRFDFDVAIVGPLFDHFNEVDATPVPMQTLGRRRDID